MSAAIVCGVAGVLALEVAEQGLKYLHHGGRGHDSHAHHRDFVEHGGIASGSRTGHLLCRIGEVKRVRCRHANLWVQASTLPYFPNRLCDSFVTFVADAGVPVA